MVCRVAFCFAASHFPQPRRRHRPRLDGLNPSEMVTRANHQRRCDGPFHSRSLASRFAIQVWTDQRALYGFQPMLDHMPTCVLVVVAVAAAIVGGEKSGRRASCMLLWFGAHGAYLKDSAFEISRLGLHRDIQTETREDASNNAAREPEELCGFTSTSVWLSGLSYKSK